VVTLILHPCLFAVLRLMRDRVAPVSASTWSLNVGFSTGFRFRNSGGVGLQKSLTLLTACVIALQLSKGCHFPKSSRICEHRLLLLLLLMPLLLVLLLPLVLSERLELGEICCCSRFRCC
jgi:hypothetical protein